MDILLQQIINGLVLGSMYALVALGYTMVYGIINLINFAHGEVLMVGALTSWTVLTALAGAGLPGWLMLLIGLVAGLGMTMAAARWEEFELHCRAALRGVEVDLADLSDTAPTLAAVAQAPVLRNSELGRYTNFVNLLGQAALAVPAACASPTSMVCISAERPSAKAISTAVINSVEPMPVIALPRRSRAARNCPRSALACASAWRTSGPSALAQPSCPAT
mgnify:CR=1 FL=1